MLLVVAITIESLTGRLYRAHVVCACPFRIIYLLINTAQKTQVIRPMQHSFGRVIIMEEAMHIWQPQGWVRSSGWWKGTSHRLLNRLKPGLLANVDVQKYEAMLLTLSILSILSLLHVLLDITVVCVRECVFVFGFSETWIWISLKQWEWKL